MFYAQIRTSWCQSCVFLWGAVIRLTTRWCLLSLLRIMREEGERGYSHVVPTLSIFISADNSHPIKTPTERDWGNSWLHGRFPGQLAWTDGHSAIQPFFDHGLFRWGSNLVDNENTHACTHTPHKKTCQSIICDRSHQRWPTGAELLKWGIWRRDIFTGNTNKCHTLQLAQMFCSSR